MVALNQVIVLFSLIIVGYIIMKLKIVNKAMKDDISNLVVNITLPAFILSSMTSNFSREILSNSIKLVGISFSMYIFAILIGWIFSKVIPLKKNEANIYRYIIAFSNCGFMGYPIVNAVLGKQGVFYAAIFNLGFTTFVWTYGVYLIRINQETNSEHMTIKEKFISAINPALIAVIFGFAFFLIGIELPYVVAETLSMIGGVTTPLSMMLIGFILSEIHLKDIVSGWKIYLLSVMRLIVMPSLVYVILSYFNFEGYLIQIPVLIAAMPAAANTAIISSKYNGNYQLASKGIFITTLLSILTIPLVIKFII